VNALDEERTAPPDSDPVDSADHAPQGGPEVAQEPGQHRNTPPPDEIDCAEDGAPGLHVINNFFAGVGAEGAVFGVANGATRRRATGTLDLAAVYRELAYFVPPADYERARSVLLDRHLVVLHGTESIGKRTAALALLRSACGPDSKLVGISPASSIADLAEREFDSGVGCLVEDHVSDGSSLAVQRFDVRRLQYRLCGAGAFLVLTAHELSAAAASSFAAVLVRCGAPDPVALLERRARDCVPAEYVTGAVREHAAALGSPALVVALVERLTAGPDAALATDDSEHEQVREWFDGNPAPRDVLAMAALTFLHGLPERTIERATALLVERAEDVAFGSAERPPTSLVLPQCRTAGLNSVCWVERHPPEQTHAGRRLRFATNGYRSLVVSELDERYGWELWEPLRGWLDTMAVEPDDEVRLQVAMGVALLAARAMPEVRASFLDPWADGLIAARRTAAYTLNLMCGDDKLAPLALVTAVSWADRVRPRRAATAAMALGGELGRRFPAEALRWLWHLAHRGLQIRTVARWSLANLLAMSAEDADGAGQVLRFARGKLRRAAETGADRIALDAVAALLAAGQVDLAEPVAAVVLRTGTDNRQTLGELWALTLRSAPHRGQAIDALLRTLRSLDPSEAEPARDLGVAIRAHLSDQDNAALAPYLDRGLRTDPAGVKGEDPARPLISALLAAWRPAAATTSAKRETRP